ncbi:MAG: cytochrome P460 family protein [Alphaproteobacteria bacterium]|nr:cytochrome P460 family protein [Alphaproteobacteria bacterium]MBU1515177.1 cytochrome P460 family protein [Alphaproteobacteria bacterium]MBU2092307.1 cytochrome P460 family protein [Alphaproteobacteria bacterium]MBU2152901.1 cytochrome P460 family protein [Alphaproteobacteria bacterium]MBU2305732.1 cytochrome P460 family protein [Alphaproteobacteria bacterium]
MRLVTVILGITAIGLAGCGNASSSRPGDTAEVAAAPASFASHSADAVDATGALRVPRDYRATYEHLGTWSIGADAPAQGAKEMHDVWASPGTAAAYRRTGQFPDGAVLVKEVFETATGPQTTAPIVSHEETLKGWFVMVRDRGNTHPGNKLWGDGWGWSWFDAANPMKTTSTDYEADCKGCHVPAQKTDWIYVQGYPALKR